MYTGRVTEIGTVIETGSRLVVGAPRTAAGLTAGGPVNVSGTCLSAVRVDCEAGRFEVEVSVETVRRSVLGDLAPGAGVNLELPLRMGDALDGHLVQGHTDAIGKVTKVDTGHGGFLRVWIRPPKRFLDEIAAKGSVAVDGVSLTVAEVLADRFSVALVPVTGRCDRWLSRTATDGLPPAACPGLTPLSWVIPDFMTTALARGSNLDRFLADSARTRAESVSYLLVSVACTSITVTGCLGNRAVGDCRHGRISSSVKVVRLLLEAASPARAVTTSTHKTRTRSVLQVERALKPWCTPDLHARPSGL